MMCRPSLLRDSRGFTLIETMVAVVMLMVVIGSIYGTFRAANMSVTRTEERTDVYQTARVLLMQINSELCSAYQPGGLDQSSLVGEDTEEGEYAPQRDKISFLTTTRRSPSGNDQAGDLCKVTYFIQTTPDNKPIGLFALEDTRPGLSISEEEAEPVLLSDMVVEFNCTYLDGITGEWQDEWTEQEKMPKAVRVEMMLKPEREDAKPITVASTANLAVSAGQHPEQAVVEGGEDE